ncbi:MAG: hypothetical protein QXP04_04770 [Candidatus Nanoarchaeia archaeon]|nr:hypothetical protein [Candidatus Jingweiarchaeum tengchongense]
MYKMKLYFFFIFLNVIAVYPQEEMIREVVSVANTQESHLDYRKITVSIPKKINDFILKWNPEFVVYRPDEYSEEINDICKNIHGCFTRTQSNVSLSVAIADFNADGIKDAAVVGHDKVDNFLIVALSTTNNTYRIIPLISSDREKCRGYSNAHYTISPSYYYENNKPPIAIVDIFKKGDVWKNMDIHNNYEDIHFKSDAILIYGLEMSSKGRHLLRWDFRFNKKLMKNLRKFKYYKDFYEGIEFLADLIDGC